MKNNNNNYFLYKTATVFLLLYTIFFFRTSMADDTTISIVFEGVVSRNPDTDINSPGIGIRYRQLFEQADFNTGYQFSYVHAAQSDSSSSADTMSYATVEAVLRTRVVPLLLSGGALIPVSTTYSDADGIGYIVRLGLDALGFNRGLGLGLFWSEWDSVQLTGGYMELQF